MSTKTTVQTNVPPPTPEETALTQAQLDLATQQLGAIERQTAFQEEQFEQLGPLVTSLEADAAAARARAEELAPIQDRLLDLQLESLERGGAATDEELALIGEATERAIAAGTSDIEAFRGRSLDQLREELAPALGLRPSDSPIIDRGGRLAGESLRLEADLVNRLRGAEASAALNFPLAREQLFSGINIAQQQLTEAQAQFQDQLAQSAFQNRLALSGQTGNLGLGLSSFGPNPNTLAALTNLRFQSAPRTQTTGGLGQAIGLAGDVFGGVGAGLTGLKAAGAFSDRRLKTNIRRIGSLVNGLGVYIYNYVWGGPQWIGVMADEVRKMMPEAVIRIGEYDAVNYTAVLEASQ